MLFLAIRSKRDRPGAHLAARIRSAADARRHAIAPVPRSHPAYRYMRDGDGDGVVCE